MPYHDAINPAPGVKVLPCPRPRQHLPLTQAKNSKKLDMSAPWTLRPQRHTIAVGLGMPSTIRTLPSMVPATKHAAPGTVRSGSKRRGHSRRPSNMSFSARFVTGSQQHQRDAAEMLTKMADMHRAILNGHGGYGLQAKYETHRLRVRLDFPEIMAALNVIEANHERRCRPV